MFVFTEYITRLHNTVVVRYRLVLKWLLKDRTSITPTFLRVDSVIFHLDRAFRCFFFSLVGIPE